MSSDEEVEELGVEKGEGRSGWPSLLSLLFFPIFIAGPRISLVQERLSAHPVSSFSSLT